MPTDPNTAGPEYVVELCPRVWLAYWSGEPGRTACIDHARRYATERGAKIALGIARRFRPFPRARVVEVTCD